MKRAYVTAISTDSYLPGVLALYKNIHMLSSYPLIVLLPDHLNEKTYGELRRRGIPFIIADDVNTPSEMLSATEEHAWFSHWAKSLFKLRVFDLCEYEKIVYIDCDMMFIESIDEAFDFPDMSATIGGQLYPGNEQFVDLSSGFMVITPRKGLSDSIAALIPDVVKTKKIFGDQDVLQAFFSDWKQHNELHLPGGYNVWFPHYQYYLENEFVKGVHFLGKKKPWMMNIFDIMAEYFKCALKGNIKGIPIFTSYIKLLKETKAA